MEWYKLMFGFKVEKWRRGSVISVAGTAVLLVVLLAARAATDNPPDDSVGTIEGEAIALQGPMTVEVVHGQVKTVLRSGNDIRVKSGQANLDLVEGGKIAICGPAHLSVLKSGASLTLALDTGVVRVHVEKQPAVTIYTAQIQAKPLAIGDGAQDALIGFDAPGMMCVRAMSGAIRLEQQLTGQSVIVPQGGDILLNNGALEGLQNTSGHCACEMQMAKGDPPPPEISRLATTEEIRQRETEAKPEAKKEPEPTAAPSNPKPKPVEEPLIVAEKPPVAPRTIVTEKPPVPVAPPVAEKPPVVPTAPPVVAEKPVPPKNSPATKQDPVYQVFMPPLAYDAKAAAPRDDFDPKLIMLVRRVRVRPTLIFEGRVEGEAAVRPVSTSKVPGANAATSPQAPANAAAPAKTDSVVNRVRAFLKGLFS
jgi:hypothetical protein